MQKLLLIGLMISSLSAIDVKVKKGDVNLSINTHKLSMQKGQTRELKEGSTICYVSGDGKLVIKELRVQLKKAGRCVMIPISKESASSYMVDMKNKMKIAFWDSTESVRHGVGTKANTEFDSSKNIFITAQQKELLLYSKEFGPLPVNVMLKDKNGQVLMNVENESSDITIVHIAKGQLKTGMHIEVYNGFDELLLSKKIIVEKI